MNAHKRLAAVLLAAVALGSCNGTGRGAVSAVKQQGIWGARAEQGQQALVSLYGDPLKNGLLDNRYPCADCNHQFNYWWQAHAVDVLVDGYQRTGADIYKQRLAALQGAILSRNGGALPNQYYDDMEWLALALLRAGTATGDAAYAAAAQTLWADIKTGWNDNQGGGVAWRKSQLDYKNTPANAPAAILAARLYQRFGQADDLAWAKRIFDWETQTLVDPNSGFVWDGINRQGDGHIDKAWEFSYCQGVYIGAAVELFRSTHDDRYLAAARRTAAAARARLANPLTGLLPVEGEGDGGLFKGIFVRYLAELVEADPAAAEFATLLQTNGERLWQDGRAADQVLFGQNWGNRPAPPVDLSVQLSGVMLLERLAALESRHLLPPGR